MTLPKEIGDREYQKFVQTDAGAVAVRTQDANINGLDSGNSTTTALISNGQFIGTWADVMQYPSILVSANTDILGTIFLEFNDTGTGNALELEQYNVYPNETFLKRVSVRKRYYRTRFDNGIPAQSYLSVNTLLGAFPSPTEDQVIIMGPDGHTVDVHMNNGVNESAVHDASAHSHLMSILDHMKMQTKLLKKILE